MTGPARLALAALALALADMVVAVALTVHQAAHHVPDSQVRALCSDYAGLDLDELAPLCEQVHYQQVAP